MKEWKESEGWEPVLFRRYTRIGLVDGVTYDGPIMPQDKGVTLLEGDSITWTIDAE